MLNALRTIGVMSPGILMGLFCADCAEYIVIIGLFYRLKESEVQRMINEMKVVGETGTTTHEL